MASNYSPRWLTWAREIQAIAQIGSHYAVDEFQRKRYARLVEIAAEIVDEYSNLDFPVVLNFFENQTGYATPRVDVRGAIFRDGKLLLVRELSDGGWTMPGGWADVGETPSKAIEREVWEESGFHVRVKQVVGVYDANRIEPLGLFHAFKVVFLCELLSGEAMPSNETSAVDFFAQDKIPAMLSAERTKIRHIQDAFSQYLNPGRATEFD